MVPVSLLFLYRPFPDDSCCDTTVHRISLPFAAALLSDSCSEYFTAFRCGTAERQLRRPQGEFQYTDVESYVKFGGEMIELCKVPAAMADTAHSAWRPAPPPPSMFFPRENRDERTEHPPARTTPAVSLCVACVSVCFGRAGNGGRLRG